MFLPSAEIIHQLVQGREIISDFLDGHQVEAINDLSDVENGLSTAPTVAGRIELADVPGGEKPRIRQVTLR